jgi:hypothetical protein
MMVPRPDYICGVCYPKIVRGTWGRIAIHLMEQHGLFYKKAKEKILDKDRAGKINP